MEFVKSSFCGTGTCVEAAPVFVKSTFSSTGNCVEAAPAGVLWVLVRDSKRPDGTVLELSHAAWYDFLDAVTAGEFADLS